MLVIQFEGEGLADFERQILAAVIGLHALTYNALLEKPEVLRASLEQAIIVLASVFPNRKFWVDEVI